MFRLLAAVAAHVPHPVPTVAGGRRAALAGSVPTRPAATPARRPTAIRPARAAPQHVAGRYRAPLLLRAMTREAAALAALGAAAATSLDRPATAAELRSKPQWAARRGAASVSRPAPRCRSAARRHQERAHRSRDTAQTTMRQDREGSAAGRLQRSETA